MGGGIQTKIRSYPRGLPNVPKDAEGVVLLVSGADQKKRGGLGGWLGGARNLELNRLSKVGRSFREYLVENWGLYVVQKQP